MGIRAITMCTMPRWVERWLARHTHPGSLVLHAIAVPMLPLAGALAAVQLRDGTWHLWWRPVTLVLVSYILQWIGHRLEGNDMGEVILVKKLLGRPFVAVHPRGTIRSSQKTER